MDQQKSNANNNIAVIRVRGLVSTNYSVERTLKQLNLYNRNYCVVISSNKSNLGMVNKIKDYVTWGEVNNDTYDLLIEKRGQNYNGRVSDNKKKIQYKRFLSLKGKKIKKFFRLNSPKKGYGRGGIKVAFNNGGALGYRGDRINELIQRMV